MKKPSVTVRSLKAAMARAAALAILTLSPFRIFAEPPVSGAAMADYDGLTQPEILVTAARDGDAKIVTQLLDAGVDINSVAALPGEHTALAAAATANRLEIVKLLMDRGANLDLQAPEGNAPVVAALLQGRMECADFLLARGAACAPDVLAAAKGDSAAITKVIKAGGLDFTRAKLLADVAAAHGHAALYVTLVDAIRALPGKGGWEPSDGAPVTAIARGHRDVVEAMIERGSGLNRVGWVRLAPAASETEGMLQWLRSKKFQVAENSDGERLIDAVEREDLAEIRRLIRSGVSPDYRGLGFDDWTPLTRAAEQGRLKSVKLLLASGADPNAIRSPGWNWTPLSLAKTPEIADLLFAAGANVNAKLFDRDVHIVTHCILYGRAPMVRWFADHGVDLAAAHGDDPSWLFLVRKPEIAEILIQHGVDVNIRSKSGSTALQHVCSSADQAAAVARVLLSHGADPNAVDNYGFTPLMSARDGATVDVLVEYGADIHAKTKDGLGVIDSTSHSSDGSRLEALIRHGAPFDIKTDGPTMLMHAAWSNQIDLMRNLLDRGVDPNAKGVWNKARGDTMTPLQAAVVDGQFDAARLLVERGAKVREAKDDKMSEMETAIYNRRKAMIQVFWEHGFRGISPLAYAISQGQPADEIEKLLEAGAPPEPPEDKHITPLGLAARQGDLQTVRLLVDRHAGVNSGDERCRPLALAAAEGQDETVAYLLEHGAKIDAEGMWQAIWNCNPYPEQREKEHFEKTIKMLIAAGFLQGISERETARLFNAAIFSRNPRGNPAVVKMLVEAGLNLDAKDESGKTILQQVRVQCTQETCQTPTKEMVALLEELEKNKRAVK